MRHATALLLLLLAAGPLSGRAEKHSTVLRLHDVHDLEAAGQDMEALAQEAISLVDDASVRIVAGHGVLAVVSGPRGHQEIEKWLQSLRSTPRDKSGKRLVAINAHVLRSRLPILPSEDGSGARALDAQQAERLLRQARTGDGIELVAAPRLTCPDRQRAEVRIQNQVFYIGEHKDEDLEVRQGEFIPDPVVLTIAEGVVLTARPFVNGEDSVELLLEVTVCGVARPIPAIRVTGVDGKCVVIQTPRTTRTTWTRAVSLSPGRRVLLNLGPMPEGDGDLIAILLSAEPVAPTAEKK